MKLCALGITEACGLPVDFWWPINTLLRMGVLETQDGGVVGVICPLSASGPLRILNEHFRR